jgi:hypothetical protein
MGTITKNYKIIILFEKNYNEERMSVLSSFETSSSPASPCHNSAFRLRE